MPRSASAGVVVCLLLTAATGTAAPRFDVTVEGADTLTVPSGPVSLTLEIRLFTDGLPVTGWQHSLLSSPPGQFRYISPGTSFMLDGQGAIDFDPIFDIFTNITPGSAVTSNHFFYVYNGLMDFGPYPPGTHVETAFIESDGPLQPGQYTLYMGPRTTPEEFFIFDSELEAYLLGPSGVFTLIVADPPQILSAVSRKQHGSAGSFDIPLGVDSVSSGDTECRGDGPTQIVVTLDKNIVAADGELNVAGDGEIQISTDPPASLNVTGAYIVGGNVLQIDLAGVPSRRCLNITLHSLAEDLGGGEPGLIMPDKTLHQYVLLGDSTNNGVVSSADVNQTKSRAGAAVDTGIFRSDITADGDISTADVNHVKAGTGNAPAACP